VLGCPFDHDLMGFGQRSAGHLLRHTRPFCAPSRGRIDVAIEADFVLSDEEATLLVEQPLDLFATLSDSREQGTLDDRS
jgi:hypothetical protein